MRTEISRVQVKKHSVEWVIVNVIAQLRWYFEDTAVGGSFESYLNKQFDEMDRDRTIKPRNIVMDFVERTRDVDDEVAVSKCRVETSIKVALYFCLQANKASISGKTPDKAWYFATEATKWQGIASGSEHAYYVRRNALSGLAKLGGQGRSDVYEPLRKFAIAEVGKRNYRSRRNAALSIKQSVLEMAATMRIPMSEQQAETTISGWLKGIPFASTRARELANIMR